MHTLSDPMQAALIDALHRDFQGVALLQCHGATARALVARALAVREPAGPVAGTRTVLTRRGRLAAAQLRDERTPVLTPGMFVTYHGSIESEHGNRFVVIAVADDGRYTIGDVDYEWHVLSQVRRASVRVACEIADLEEPEMVAPICEPGDVLVASHNRAAASLVALAPEMREAMQRIRRYRRMAADAKSPGGRARAESEQAQMRREYNVLSDQWARLHRLLDARTAVLVAAAIRAQFPDPEQREKYLR